MNDIYVFNRDLGVQGIIDEYVSIIWRPSYNEIGDFEIYMGASAKAVELLQPNRYVVRSSDISVVDGVATYKKVMVIKNIQLITDVENGDFLCVTGRELKYLLHQRIVWNNQTITDSVEYVLRRLIGNNAINPVEDVRAIPNMTHAEPKGYGGEDISVQPDHVPLDEAIVDICKTYNYGWDIYISNGLLTVDIYKGVDRSYGQTERPYVVFSESFENLYGTEYVYESGAYANMTLIGGEGEEFERVYAYVNHDLSGLDRYEVFTDGSDISQTVENEDAEEGEATEELMPQEEYVALLEERGRENLATFTISEGFTGEVLSDVAFSYGKDFDLGDIVTVINKYGMTKNVRVLSAIESEDENGVKLLPQFSV